MKKIPLWLCDPTALLALLTSKSLDEILWYYPSSETSLEELLFAAIILFAIMLQIEIFHHHFFYIARC